MASADEYAAWIVKNADKKGTPEFATVAAAYQDARGQTATQSNPPARSWSDVPMEAVKNIPSSAGNFLGGIGQAIMHPIDTASGALDIAAGGLKNALPKSVSGLVDKADWNPQATDRAVKAADAVGSMYKQRYGSAEGIKNTLATDPVGVAADLSTLLGVGAVATPGKVSNALAKASTATNPLSAIGPVARVAGKVAEPVGSNVLGVMTGVGADNVRAAARSGLEGKTAFFDNLSGKADMTDVLDAAKQNVQNMGAQKAAEYRSGMANVKGDKTVIKFDNIDDAVDKARNTVSFKGQVKNEKGAQVTQQIADEINKWKSLDPAEYHTPEGLDALKQKIGGMVDSIPFEEKTARLVAGNIYNSVKNEISAQAPTYAKTMKDYSEATDVIREIEKSLSLGNKASADTAMRKLQSLSRNNVNTNYGNRLNLAKQLESQGGNELLPAIAGQAMNTWVPRGLAGQAEGIATLGAAALHSPLMLATLPFQSPKAVGASLYGAGKAANALSNIRSPLTADQIKNLGLIYGQAGSVTANQGKNDAGR